MKVAGKDQTISGETFETLRARILAGEIAPGSKVKAQEVSQSMGVSLGAVREALSQLIAEGLVCVEAHRGYTVMPLSIADLLDLTRISRGKVELHLRAVDAHATGTGVAGGSAEHADGAL